MRVKKTQEEKDEDKRLKREAMVKEREVRKIKKAMDWNPISGEHERPEPLWKTIMSQPYMKESV